MDLIENLVGKKANPAGDPVEIARVQADIDEETQPNLSIYW